jgi:hypothetical protein
MVVVLVPRLNESNIMLYITFWHHRENQGASTRNHHLWQHVILWTWRLPIHSEILEDLWMVLLLSFIALHVVCVCVCVCVCVWVFFLSTIGFYLESQIEACWSSKRVVIICNFQYDEWSKAYMHAYCKISIY